METARQTNENDNQSPPFLAGTRRVFRLFPPCSDRGRPFVVMKHTPLRVRDEDGSIGTVETVEGLPFIQIQPVGPEFSDNVVERNRERQRRAHVVVDAYNSTPSMQKALQKVLAYANARGMKMLTKIANEGLATVKAEQAGLKKGAGE